MPSGSGPGFRRPVLVVQSNPFNESRIDTVIVVVITSNVRLADAPGNVRLGKSETGLSKPSVINVSQLLSLDRDYLETRVKPLNNVAMQRVDDGLRLVLEI